MLTATIKTLANRVDQLVELLGFDRQKIIAWGFAQAVLAAAWRAESEVDNREEFFKIRRSARSDLA